MLPSVLLLRRVVAMLLPVVLDLVIEQSRTSFTSYTRRRQQTRGCGPVRMQKMDRDDYRL